MEQNIEKLKLISRDLRNDKIFPRSPRETLGGYVLAARALDKCRSAVLGWEGEYHSNCPVDQIWLHFAEIDYNDFRTFVATGAADDEVAAWIQEHAKKRTKIDIIKWNNKLREMRLSDLGAETQEYMEGYIEEFIPKNRVIYRWFDVYDIEEQHM